MIVYETATLNIPEGSINLYKNTPGWSPFFNINGVTSLPPCKLDKQNQADDWIYTLNGERIDSSNGSFLNKGIYIKNGKKVIIK